MSSAALASPLRLSVVIASYNRGALLLRLLGQLAEQRLPRGSFEVVVVDDGSTPPVAAELEAAALDLELTLVTQANTGQAAARHVGLGRARGEVVVILDDDMQVGPEFLSRHLEAHPEGSRNVVLGWIRPDRALDRMPLFERYHARMLDHFVAEVRSGRLALQGTNLCTGNVSFRRTDYLSVGGFDVSFKQSHDAELGVRLQKAGVTLTFSDQAYTLHASDHTSLGSWMRRAFLYGVNDLQIAHKHPEVLFADPWRYLWLVHPLSRLPLLASVFAPWLARPLARLGMQLALGLDRLGAHRAAIAGTTVVYGVEYFRGVRHQAGSLRQAVAGLRRHRRQRRVAAQRRVASSPAGEVPGSRTVP